MDKELLEDFKSESLKDFGQAKQLLTKVYRKLELERKVL